MELQEQIRIMKGQLENFDCLAQKLAYMVMAFDCDPEYTKEARNIVRGDISKEIKLKEK